MHDRAGIRWPVGLSGIGYGGDYNPEQWNAETRLADLELMQAAGVNIVSLGVFAWAALEPRPGEYTFGWLDETLDGLHRAGVRVALGTATAAPPPWLPHRYPEVLPHDEFGRVLSAGSRQAFSVCHPTWRAHALRITEQLATRYHEHPSLALWHVDNEMAAHVPVDYSPAAAAAFRVWLTARYGTIEAVNDAWGNAFWSELYSSFDEIGAPTRAPASRNPAKRLDYRRFMSDAWLGYYEELATTLRRHTPDVPITTNFMVMTRCDAVDYYRWGARVDVVATDHYVVGDDPAGEVELAMSADLTRGIAGGRPWILMEHATSAVNWQPVNLAKSTAESLRQSLSHLARGADSIMFFQWRQSLSGSEKFHSAMVPHAGTDSERWRATVRLGEWLGRLAEVCGSTVHADVAIVVDYEAWWACSLGDHPSTEVGYLDAARDLYTALWRRGVTVDFVHPEGDLGGYRLVFVPTLYMMSAVAVVNVEAAVAGGAHVVVTYFSGIVDANDRVVPGGYPGALRDLLGIVIEEFIPLRHGGRAILDDGSVGSVWSERGRVTTAELVASYADGPAAGSPAIARARHGDASAWYVGTRLTPKSLDRFVGEVLADAGVRAEFDPSPGLEVVVRRGRDADYVFLINHTDAPVASPVSGTDLLTGDVLTGDATVDAGAVRVVRRSR